MQQEHNPNLQPGSIKGAMKMAGASSADLWKVPRSEIKVMPGFNGRDLADPENQQHIQTLATSIMENGFYLDKPLACFVAQEGGEDVIYVVEGHSRLAAIDLAAERGFVVELVPVVIKPRGTSVEDLTVGLYTGNTGKAFSPLETGLLCKRLVGMGLDETAISSRLGLGAGYVNDLLLLAGSPKALREMVTLRQVSATLAIEALKKHGDKALEKLTGAVSRATESGKAKATAKDMDKVELDFDAFDEAILEIARTHGVQEGGKFTFEEDFVLSFAHAVLIELRKRPEVKELR